MTTTSDDVVRVRVIADPTYGTTRHDWVVLAHWHGAERVVRRGTAYECARYAAEVRRLNPDDAEA